MVYMLNVPFSQLTISRFYIKLMQATVELTSLTGVHTTICSVSLTVAGIPSTLPRLVPKKYQSLEFLRKKQLETTGSSSPNVKKYLSIYKFLNFVSRISSQMLITRIDFSLSVICLEYQVTSGSTIFLYDVMTVSFFIFSIEEESILYALAGLLSQLPTSRCVSSKRVVRLIRQVLDCLSINYSYSLLVILPFLRMLKESIWGCRKSTTFMVQESTTQTVFSPKHRIKRVQFSFSTSPSIFQGRSACWLIFMQSPSCSVNILIRSS